MRYESCSAPSNRRPPQDEDPVYKSKLVGRWAHCRRYFFEAAVGKHPIGVQGLIRIRATYAADNFFPKLPTEKRKLVREEHVHPAHGRLLRVGEPSSLARRA